MTASSRPAFHLRLNLDDEAAIGPGKADLLQAIAETGSISGAGRRLRMSYRRAWQLAEALNLDFGGDVVETLAGGKGGGGARLTDRGNRILACYRRIQLSCAKAIASDLTALKKLRTKR